MPEASPVALPHVARSPSALLGATHVFTVQVLGAKAPAWSELPSATEERRELHLRLKVLENFKGKLDKRPEEEFDLAVLQIREGAIARDLGLWSQVQPEPGPGVQYLVLAETPSEQATVALAAENCRALLAPSLVFDVRQSLAAEQIYRGVPQEEPRAQAAAERKTKALLDFSRASCVACQNLYGEYLWARLEPDFVAEGARDMDGVLALIGSASHTDAFRAALLEAFTLATTTMPLLPPQRAHLINAYLSLLGAAPMFGQQFVDSYLYSVIFDGQDQPRSPSSAAASEAARARAALQRYDSERARRIATWLAHK